MRTDDNNNPAAIITDVVRQSGLIFGTDWENGTPFPHPSDLVTARLLGDPVQLTIRIIDVVGYQTHLGNPRWTYINMPKFIWHSLTADQKRDVIGYHYQHEGGTALRHLFPNYGAI